MLAKYIKTARIERASIHTLRHTFGAHHVARGTDPKTVQDVMGLKDDRSVAVYHLLAKEVMLNVKVIISPDKKIKLEGWFTPESDSFSSTSS